MIAEIMRTNRLKERSHLSLHLIQYCSDVPDRVEATISGSDSANSLGVLANSDGDSGGGGRLDNDLTEEERETVNYACAVHFDNQ